MWLKVRKDAGEDALRFHDLRQLHATLMLAQGTQAKVVREGHSSVRVTLDTYTQVPLSLQADAAAAFDRVLASAT